MVDIVIFAAVNAHFGPWELEDQPAAASVDAGDFEHVAKEGAVCVFITREDHHMSAADHWLSPSGSANSASITKSSGNRRAVQTVESMLRRNVRHFNDLSAFLS